MKLSVLATATAIVSCVLLNCGGKAVIDPPECTGDCADPVAISAQCNLTCPSLVACGTSPNCLENCEPALAFCTEGELAAVAQCWTTHGPDVELGCDTLGWDACIDLVSCL